MNTYMVYTIVTKSFNKRHYKKPKKNLYIPQHTFCLLFLNFKTVVIYKIIYIYIFFPSVSLIFFIFSYFIARANKFP